MGHCCSPDTDQYISASGTLFKMSLSRISSSMAFLSVSTCFWEDSRSVEGDRWDQFVSMANANSVDSFSYELVVSDTTMAVVTLFNATFVMRSYPDGGTVKSEGVKIRSHWHWDLINQTTCRGDPPHGKLGSQ